MNDARSSRYSENRTDPSLSLDFDFDKNINRALLCDLATARLVAPREDALLLGPPGTAKSHLAQAIGTGATQQGDRVPYRDAHTLIEEIVDANVNGTRKACFQDLGSVPTAHHP